RATVGAAILEGLLLATAWRGILFDSNRQRILLTRSNRMRDIEAPAHEGAFDPADFFAIEKNVCLPVDAIEVQPHDLASLEGGRSEFCAVPEIGIEIGIGDVQLVLSDAGIRHRFEIQVRG